MGLIPSREIVYSSGNPHSGGKSELVGNCLNVVDPPFSPWNKSHNSHFDGGILQFLDAPASTNNWQKIPI